MGAKCNLPIFLIPKLCFYLFHGCILTVLLCLLMNAFLTGMVILIGVLRFNYISSCYEKVEDRLSVLVEKLDANPIDCEIIYHLGTTKSAIGMICIQERSLVAGLFRMIITRLSLTSSVGQTRKRF